MPIESEKVAELSIWQYFTDTYNQVTIIDENENMFKLRVGDYPKQPNEVLISDYMAQILIRYEIFEGIDSIDLFLEGMTLLYVNWLNILIVFLFALMVIVISSFLPVRSITKMKLIEAIKKAF